MTYSRIEELKWRASWHFTMARLLETKPLLFTQENVYFKAQTAKKGQAPLAQLLSDTQVEEFSCGYYYFNCMMGLI